MLSVNHLHSVESINSCDLEESIGQWVTWTRFICPCACCVLLHLFVLQFDSLYYCEPGVSEIKTCGEVVAAPLLTRTEFTVAR